MNWKSQAALATILALLGLAIAFNPVTVVSAASSVLPWVLFAAAGIQFLSILFRRRRVFRATIVPGLTGALLAYAGASMKFGDPSTIGPISLYFVLALLLLGSAGAKSFLAYGITRSKYFNFVAAAAGVSAILGLIVFFNWSVVSAGLIGVFVGLELVTDAVVMTCLALRERDGEEAMETLGLDPVEEAAKAAAAANAAAARAAETRAAAAQAAAVAAEAAAIRETEASATRAAQAASLAKIEAASLAAAEAASLAAAEAAAPPAPAPALLVVPAAPARAAPKPRPAIRKPPATPAAKPATKPRAKPKPAG